MASCGRSALLCLVVIMACVFFSRIQADLMETSTARDINVTVSTEESETDKHLHVENVTRADFGKLSRREDVADNGGEEVQEKPKDKQDPYTKNILDSLDLMRTDFTHFDMNGFMKVVKDTKLVNKPATSTTATTEVDDENGRQEVVRVIGATRAAQVDDGENGQDGAEEVDDTQGTADGSSAEHAGSPYTKNLMKELHSMHRNPNKFDLGQLFTAINKDKEFRKGSTIKRTADNGNFHFGGNSTGDCVCKTSDGVCHSVDAQLCLFNNGTRIAKCKAGGKWMLIEECKKTCEWPAGKLPVCVN